jgi:hypothetical protein
MGSVKEYKYKILIYNRLIIYLDTITDFEKVSQVNLNKLVAQSVSDIKEKEVNKRTANMYFYNSKNNLIDVNTAFINTGRTQDYLIVYPTFGTQIINSTVAPQIDINADLLFNWKNSPGQKFGLSATFLFMPDKDDFYNINTYNFANISYYLKFNKKWSHKISVGYLFDKNGNHFSDNTWNAFWHTNIKDIGVKIGGYYTKNTDGNYMTIPSFGISIGF